METEHAMLFKIACGLHGKVTLFEATPQCLYKNSVNVSVSRIACDCEYALLYASATLVYCSWPVMFTYSLLVVLICVTPLVQFPLFSAVLFVLVDFVSLLSRFTRP